jgi:hypothetical protein
MTLNQTILFIVLVLLLVVFGPFVSIWALNTLFPVLAIPYTFNTWAAVVILKSFLTVQVNKKD